MAKNPYDILGVSKSASEKDIKAAFRRLAKKHHPDQNPDNPKAQESFSEVNQAYEILGDEEKRKAFDSGEIDAEGKPRFQGYENAGGDPFSGFRRSGRTGPGGSQFEFHSTGFGGDAGDVFSEIFGQAFRGANRGRSARPEGVGDLRATLDVSIDDIATGARVTAVFPDGRKLAVKLPSYVEDGQTIRLKGQGAETPYGERGDALIKLIVRQDGPYRIEGRNLHIDVPVSLRDAVLGARVAVETPAGRVAVSVPPWSSSDRVLRLKGRGLPLKTKGHGDLYAHVRIMLPEGGDPELEELFRKAEV